MTLFDRLRRVAERRSSRSDEPDSHDVADEDLGDRALNSSHFDDVDYDPVDDEE